MLTPEQVQAARQKYGIGTAATTSRESVDDWLARLKGETPKKRDGFSISETLGDLKETATGIRDAVTERSDRFNQGVSAALRGEQSVRDTAYQLAGQAAGGAADISGNLIMGAGKAVLPQSAEDAVADAAKTVAAPIVQSDTVQGLIAKYESLKQTDPDMARNIDATLGLGSFALSFAGGAGASRAAQGASRVAAQAAQHAASAARGVSSVGKYTAGRVPKLLGIFSGESDDVIRYALQNPKVANLGIEQGDEALRAAVREGAENSLKIRDSFIKGHSAAKKKVMGEYTKTLVPKNDVKGEFNKLLRESGVKVGKGELDFSTSKIVANPGEIKKIQDAWTALDQWDKFTIDSLDEYKQLVGQLTRFADEAGIPSKSPFLGKLYNRLNEIAYAKLPKEVASKYRTLNKRFADNIEMYDDIVEAFNSGDPFTKLANALGKNRDTLRQTLQFYEKQSGKNVLPIVAGRELAMEKNAAFGILNPRSWIDLLISPAAQGKVITKIGEKAPKLP